VYVWEGRINVTSDHVHVYALERGVNVASDIDPPLPYIHMDMNRVNIAPKLIHMK
jgi:hypothetical protein